MFNRRMVGVAEISDRFEIQRLLFDYSTVVGRHRFDDVHRVFTPDAHTDF